jgi:hypothetical protein
MQTSLISRSFRVMTPYLAAACAGLGFYVFNLRSDLAALRGELAAARTERDGARHGEAAARGQLLPLEENVARLTAERDGLRKATAGASADATSTAQPARAANQSGGIFAQTIATPEMRQMIHREALSDARKGFSDLLKKWNLSAAEADQFLQFVADRDSADGSDALAMLATGKLDAKSIAGQQARQEKMRRENNARLKALLGDRRYADFEAADARAAERKAVSTYRDHLEAAGAPLTDDQRAALAKIVMKEKPDENDWQPEDVEFFTQGMTDAQLLKLRQRLETAHTRIAQEATSFLSPDQVAALQGAFRSELEEQDLAMKMVRTWLQSAAPAAAAK